VQGFLHSPSGRLRAALALTHGASGNCSAPLLVALAEAFAEHGFAVLRYDLPYRQARPSGGPTAAQARDREGIRAAAESLREHAKKVPLYLGGSSYGGRQSSMLAAEDQSISDGLLMLSYPLHPPGQPEKLRTDHFPSLTMPVLFVHGTRDQFGTIAELDRARLLIPGRTEIREAQGAPHGLPPKIAPQIAEWFVTFVK
jgi:predicted alpha/beta-hydrolase family hydrolase